MKRLAIIGIILCCLFTAAGRATNSFESHIEEVRSDSLLVACSDEANKGKKGGIDSIGYVCTVKLTDRTIVRDEKGNLSTVGLLSAGSSVKLNLTRSVDIRGAFEKGTAPDLTAKEIVIIKI